MKSDSMIPAAVKAAKDALTKLGNKLPKYEMVPFKVERVTLRAIRLMEGKFAGWTVAITDMKFGEGDNIQYQCIANDSQDKPVSDIPEALRKQVRLIVEHVATSILLGISPEM